MFEISNAHSACGAGECMAFEGLAPVGFSLASVVATVVFSSFLAACAANCASSFAVFGQNLNTSLNFSALPASQSIVSNCSKTFSLLHIQIASGIVFSIITV
jgi:hypothetical protein